MVITGTRLPISTLAFSLLRARMRGLASTLEMPVVLRASMVTDNGETEIVSPLWFFRSLRTILEGVLILADEG